MRGATIGEMREWVVIQTPTTASSTQSTSGTVSFSTLATVPAAVRALSGTEQLAAGSVTSHVTYEIETRQRSDVTPRMRVVWTPYSASAKTFEIHTVRIGGRHDRMILECGVAE